MTARATTKPAPAIPTPTARDAEKLREAAALAAPALAPKLTIIEIMTLVIAVVIAIAAARVAEPFLVPVVAGILLSYALRPLVTMLERRRVPRLAAAAFVMSVLVGALSATGYAIRDEVSAAVAELPAAARKLRYAITTSSSQPGPMTHMKEAAKELDQAAAEATGAKRTTVAPPDRVATQVESFVEAQYAKAMTVLTEVIFGVLLAFFLLASGDTFRRKVAKLAGDSLARRRVTVEVLNEIDAQVQKYLVTLLAANVLIAVATWLALLVLGLPNAGMWGAITGVLHVVPYAGAAVAIFGIGVAMFLHSASIASAMIAMAVVGVLATLIGVGYMSWLQGKASSMNPVAVFIGVLFFGWLWGGWGLLLGLPILAVLKSISDRVESMRPVSELLGT